MFKFADGRRYEGDFHQNKMCGHGKSFAKSGVLVYDGLWKDNQMNGEGRSFAEDGSSHYEGEH